MTSEQLVLLHTFYDVTQAHIARGLLEANNIPCHIFDEHLNSIAWHLQIGVGGTRLMVPENYAEEAIALLEEEFKFQQETRKSKKPLTPSTLKGKVKATLSVIISLLTSTPFVLKDQQRD